MLLNLTLKAQTALIPLGNVKAIDKMHNKSLHLSLDSQDDIFAFYSRRKCSRAPSLVDELLNEIYSRFSSTNGETTSDMSAPYQYGHEFERDEGNGKSGEMRHFYGTSRY